MPKKTPALPQTPVSPSGVAVEPSIIETERDRDRANRLYDEVNYLAHRLAEHSKSEPHFQDLTLEEIVNRLKPTTFKPAPRQDWMPTVADMPPEQISHHDVNRLDDTEGTVAGDIQWERIRRAAQSDLFEGRQARKALTHDLECNSTPYTDVTFLITYEALCDEWSPKGISELLILQHMTQAHTLAQLWMQRLTRYSMGMATTVKEEDDRAKYGEWVPPRMSAVEAVEMCSRHVVRFTNLYLKQIRALRDLRRYSVTINNPAQVNIGEKQINVRKA